MRVHRKIVAGSSVLVGMAFSAGLAAASVPGLSVDAGFGEEGTVARVQVVCDETPVVTYRMGTASMPVDVVRETDGSWQGTVILGSIDGQIRARCGSAELDPVLTDPDSPGAAFSPQGSSEVPSDPLGLYGWDCPNDGMPYISLSGPAVRPGPPPTIPGVFVDGAGNWIAPIPSGSSGVVVVTAYCGDLTPTSLAYSGDHLTVPSSSTIRSSTTSPSQAMSVSSPPSARPVSQAPSYTG